MTKREMDRLLNKMWIAVGGVEDIENELYGLDDPNDPGMYEGAVGDALGERLRQEIKTLTLTLIELDEGLL